MIQEVLFYLGILLVAAIVPPLVAYIISRFAAIGWRRGNQLFEKWEQEDLDDWQHPEKEIEDDGEESKTEGL